MSKVLVLDPGHRSRRPRLLSRRAEYALRVMVQLADSGESTLLRGEDLAARTGVPRHYLAKILCRLRRAKLLVSQKGRYGGFGLARPAETIRFSDVLRAVGEQAGVGGCNPRCVRRNSRCPVHGAQRALLEWAAGQTISGGRTRARGAPPGRAA